MKKLDIAITKAQLTGFGVRFDDDGEIRVEAKIALLTEQNRHVTDFDISTHSWMDQNKFEMPLSLHEPIRKIAMALEQVIVIHLREGQLALGSQTMDAIHTPEEQAEIDGMDGIPDEVPPEEIPF